MRRTTRRSLFHLVVFIGILSLIICWNRPPTAKKIFTWTKIRYQTTAAALPESRGHCPGLVDTSKPALVVSRVEADGDPSWLQSLSEKYHLCIYNVDVPPDPSSQYLQVPANRGHESMAYLTFLIDNYADIPEAGAVLVHGSRWAWHNDAPDYDNAYLLSVLNVSSALDPWGYHNLRCDWSVSTCPSSTPPQGSLQMSLQSVLDPWDARAASDAALPQALRSIFGKDALAIGRHDAIRSQCCAQFVVARERVWNHSRAEYIALRQWLLDGSHAIGNPRALRREGIAPRDDRVAGRIISYIWHILFLDLTKSGGGSPEGGLDLDALNQLACPRADECYCRLYGRCNLEHCSSPGRCYGQYEIPPDFTVPASHA
ncbi:hypothetical protein ARAM_000568 [Aspergillus rambellii]|uniref:Uncharacterized protein n=1 Tax=Aspergillus rambellii TaxID=308745 RepID=A0A0F8W5P1_9EURO|nr:hypothetical protein ARAM_000568 [Aspergillus rambellii]